MNPIADFFRRHGAVPANDTGPQWDRASEAVLLGWFGQLASIVRCGWNAEAGRNATPTERQGQASLYAEIVAEVQRRASRSDASPEIMAAAFRAVLPVSI
jgi:hypothetical protein